MMKKTAAILLTGVLVLEAGSMSAFADEDGDGICDNCHTEKKAGKKCGRGKFCKTGERRCEVNRK